MELTVTGELWFWRGPAPHHFVWVPEEQCAALRAAAAAVTYGWGMIPVTARVGGTTWTTSLFPKDGRYLAPVRASVRRAEGIEPGEPVSVHLSVDV
ncbi:DUF1905 domain-containing protein [Micromonospora cathayae]|uniref:DUF1905 domain-containing protein n=1 Tax=Micromonospora cathayae TaxID=3028804 RepID=A0ABY7ZJG0_9ACTN|nr:DUF1905 domain-containing protein [Micromonospora sp. HUAS 3]WDZ83023.1 DUF1905 domain-containing protein [Micromonospora sp. HUAS 3]